jgi:PilZ domain-containing protein
MEVPFRLWRGCVRGIPLSTWHCRTYAICDSENRMPERSNEPIVIPAPKPVDSQGRTGPNRRGERRFPLSAAAEVIEIRSQTRVTGRCSDLGAGGCYVDTFSPFTAGTLVRIHIVRGSVPFEAEGVVAYAHVPMGMGLAFKEIRPEYQKVLHSWIAELSGEPPPEAQIPVSQEVVGPPPEIENLRQVLNDLINLMVRKRILSADERARLLRQIFG